MKLGITRVQRSNLKTLANYLDSLPANYSHFGMSNFFQHNGREINVTDLDTVCTPCGTAACAVGHAPGAGIPIHEDDEDWADYSERVFGLNAFADNRWGWCFCGWWDQFDNSHYGAAARIRYLLKHGAAPTEFVSVFAKNWRPFIAEYAEFRKASVDTHPKGRDLLGSGLLSGAVPEGQTPNT